MHFTPKVAVTVVSYEIAFIWQTPLSWSNLCAKNENLCNSLKFNFIPNRNKLEASLSVSKAAQWNQTLWLPDCFILWKHCSKWIQDKRNIIDLWVKTFQLPYVRWLIERSLLMRLSTTVRSQKTEHFFNMDDNSIT